MSRISRVRRSEKVRTERANEARGKIKAMTEPRREELRAIIQWVKDQERPVVFMDVKTALELESTQLQLDISMLVRAKHLIECFPRLDGVTEIHYVRERKYVANSIRCNERRGMRRPKPK